MSFVVMIDGLNSDYSGMYSTRSGIDLRNDVKLYLTVKGTNTLDGVRLQGRPVKKGIYIYNGKKVIIK